MTNRCQQQANVNRSGQGWPMQNDLHSSISRFEEDLLE